MQGAERVADRLLAALDEPVEIEGRDLMPRASIGIVDGSSNGATAARLLSDADIAMYQAKRAGKGRARRYEPGSRSLVQDRLELESDLRQALARNELHVTYQPIVEVATGRPVSVEALVRWAHPKRGLLLPTAFIPLAEEIGLIVDIGSWVVRESCRQVAEWRSGPAPALGLSVNVAPQELAQPDFVATIMSSAGAAGLPLDSLMLEVTESALLDDASVALDSLHRIRETGRPGRDRRLRHRLFVAQLPEPPSRGRAQDRPGVRGGARRRHRSRRPGGRAAPRRDAAAW